MTVVFPASMCAMNPMLRVERIPASVEVDMAYRGLGRWSEEVGHHQR